MIFPQANNPTKLTKLLEVSEGDLINNELLKDTLNVKSDRQVNYYLSALEYLGFVKNRMFTEKRNNINFFSKHDIEKHIIKEILSKDIFFEVFYEIVFFK